MKIQRTIQDASGQSMRVSEVLQVEVKPGWKGGTKITFPEKGEHFHQIAVRASNCCYWQDDMNCAQEWCKFCLPSCPGSGVCTGASCSSGSEHYLVLMC